MEKDYKERPLIEGIEYKYFDNEIVVFDNSTTFVQIRKDDAFISISDISKLVSEIKEKIKKSGGKIVVKGLEQYFERSKSIHGDYEKSFHVLANNFNKIKVLVKELETKGIRFGCRDCSILTEISRIRNESSNLTVRNGNYSILKGIYLRLTEIRNSEEYLKEGCVKATYNCK